jgi:hypothetical protein
LFTNFFKCSFQGNVVQRKCNSLATELD